MRPLVVLLLVVASLAALLFALTTLTDTGRQGEGVKPLTVDPAPKAQASPELVDPALPTRTEEVQPVPEEKRQALQTTIDASGSGVKFGAIEGLVVDEEGNPVAAARVTLLNVKPSGFGEDLYVLRGVDPPRPTAKVDTEANGFFRFDRLDPRKDWSLAVTHERYLRWESDSALPVREEETWLETVVLKPGLTCSGVVRDGTTSQPIPGVLLISDSPMARMNNKASASQLKAVTDANGAYAFNNPSATPRTLTITAQGYATQVHTNFAMVNLGARPTLVRNVQKEAQLEARKQDFELLPGKAIAGRVLAPDHRGASGIQVEALNQAGTIGSQGFATSSANGEYLIEGLAEGIYTVRVTPGEYDAHPLQRVEAGDTNAILQLFEQASVTGMVVDENGRPLTNFTVKARSVNEVSKAQGEVAATRVVKNAKDGAFELSGLAEASYVIEGLAEGYASSFSDAFNATQGLLTSDIVVHMTHGGSLSGLVLDSYSNAPIVGAEVSTNDNNWIEGDFFELFGAMEPSALTRAKVRTDAEGRFAIAVMTPDTYQVQVKAKGYAHIFVNDVVIADGQNTDLPTQMLSKGATITGVVYGRDGTIATGASVQLNAQDGDLYGSRTTRADATGKFVIENALPGKYQLSATRASTNTGSPFEAIGDMNQSKIEISIEDGGQYEFDLNLARGRGN